MLFRKTAAFAAAALTAVSLLACPVSAGKVRDGYETAIDMSGVVQAYSNSGKNGEYYTDKDGSRLDGYFFCDLSYPDEPEANLKYAEFRDGTLVNSDYTGFTKSSKGKRYYINGRRVYGWCKIGGSWYHFDPYNGLMSSGKTNVCGTDLVFDKNGRWSGKIPKDAAVSEPVVLKVFCRSNYYGFYASVDADEIYYGSKGMGEIHDIIDIPKEDRYILYLMLLENGFAGSVSLNIDIDEEYINSFLEEYTDGGEYGHMIGEYDTTWDITFFPGFESEEDENGSVMIDIFCDLDAERISYLDRDALRAVTLCKGYYYYLLELLKEYPYTGDLMLYEIGYE